MEGVAMSATTILLFVGGFITGGVLTMIVLATLSRLTKRNQELELYSDCCGAHAVDELWEEPDGSYSGRCAKCKENTMFRLIEDER
jgi:hypothetical protein